MCSKDTVGPSSKHGGNQHAHTIAFDGPYQDCVDTGSVRCCRCLRDAGRRWRRKLIVCVAVRVALGSAIRSFPICIAFAVRIGLAICTALGITVTICGVE